MLLLLCLLYYHMDQLLHQNPTMAAPEQAKRKILGTIIADALAKTEVVMGMLPVGYKSVFLMFDSEVHIHLFCQNLLLK